MDARTRLLGCKESSDKPSIPDRQVFAGKIFLRSPNTAEGERQML